MLPKLVRDKIPQIIVDNNKTPVYKQVSLDDYKRLVLEKMCEELLEFEESPSLEEAADIYEVFLSILSAHDFNLNDVLNYASKKRYERGAFDHGIVLEQVI